MNTDSIIPVAEELDELTGEQIKAARAELESPYLILDSIVASAQLEGEMRTILSRHFPLREAEIERVLSSLPESPDSRRDALLDLAAYCAVLLASDMQHAFPHRLS